ncbi:HTH_Tnp_Tc3_2 domain-containing protein [Trichonephila clavipes]|nr:HTH_Tnp_Tc3_2 domain-containing protein [Trichonephila clavipes]
MLQLLSSFELYTATGIRVSRATVSRRLYERGLYSIRPVVCVTLYSANRSVHLNWCRDHRDWSMDQWTTILFTNEFQFNLTNDYRRIFIRREPETHDLPSNIQKIDH